MSFGRKVFFVWLGLMTGIHCHGLQSLALHHGVERVAGRLGAIGLNSSAPTGDRTAREDEKVVALTRTTRRRGEYPNRVTDGSAGRSTGTSAVPQIADDFVRHASWQRWAITGLMHRKKHLRSMIRASSGAAFLPAPYNMISATFSTLRVGSCLGLRGGYFPGEVPLAASASWPGHKTRLCQWF